MQDLSKTITNYASLVKFSHSIFAIPFALIGFCYGYTSMLTPPASIWILLIKMLGCMVFARNAAMAFNRYADRKIDAQNLRTKNREIPAGIVSAKGALAFCIANVVLFVACTATINLLCLGLSPIALVVVLGYSYTKRFTSLCHIVLGLGLAIAPMGAYIAVCSEFALTPMILSAMVLTWVGGFDIIYALQDTEFDQQHSLKSIPSQLGNKRALMVSTLLHVVSVILVFVLAHVMDTGTLYYIGAVIFSLLIIYQHSLVKADDLSRVGLAFGTVNGIASVIYCIFTVADMFV